MECIVWVTSPGIQQGANQTVGRVEWDMIAHRRFARIEEASTIVCLYLDFPHSPQWTDTMTKTTFIGRIMALAAAGLIAVGTAAASAQSAPAPRLGRTAPGIPAPGQPPPLR